MEEVLRKRSDLIETIDDLNQGIEYLKSVEPRFNYAAKIVGPIPLRRRQGGFHALMEMIISQQVSVAAASSIQNKLRLNGLDQPEIISNASEKQLMDCGVSRRKAEYLKSLAETNLDFDTLHIESNEQIINRLVSIRGIGLWTAEIYLMFAVGCRDVIAAGDLALQESTRGLFELDKRPGESKLRQMAEQWKPWRTAAACLLWGYYRKMKNREGVFQ